MKPTSRLFVVLGLMPVPQARYRGHAEVLQLDDLLLEPDRVERPVLRSLLHSRPRVHLSLLLLLVLGRDRGVNECKTLLPSASSPSSSSWPSPPSMCSWRQHTQGERQRRRQSTWPDKCRSPSRTRFAAVKNALLCWWLSSSAQSWCLEKKNIFLFHSFTFAFARMFQFAKWFWSESKKKKCFCWAPPFYLDPRYPSQPRQCSDYTITTWSFLSKY